MAILLLSELISQGKKTILALEMVSVKDQPFLDALHDGTISLDEFPHAIQWEKVWGHDYSLYQPLITFAQMQKIPMYGVNIPHITLKRLAENKHAVSSFRVPVHEEKWLPTMVVPPPFKQLSELKEVYKKHTQVRMRSDKAQTPKGTFKRFLYIQSLWDSAMAENSSKLRRMSTEPVVILAGSMHVKSGNGIPHRLRYFDPGTRIVLVMPLDKNTLSPQPLPTAHADQADLFYIPLPKKCKTRAYDRLCI